MQKYSRELARTCHENEQQACQQGQHQEQLQALELQYLGQGKEELKTQ